MNNVNKSIHSYTEISIKTFFILFNIVLVLKFIAVRIKYKIICNVDEYVKECQKYYLLPFLVLKKYLLQLIFIDQTEP